MKWVGVMTAGSAASWLAVAGLLPEFSVESFYGMLGPLVAVAATWLLVERTARVNPAGMTTVLLAAFAVKMTFFALYVVLVVTVLDVVLAPFALSFTGYFVSLYAAEAILLRRLSSRLT
jgi:hypothetical protein